ncbi:hypothetical protein CYMTET_21160 [Cymbomonas tetramitiformis]|uniref:Uncharacterized protein n=1 Tax=Cymbomonas tetramitiformis TaxID=36881 RepID=A0AAE0G2P9_9CHLO|nr:hypothetical protein CYMTET_21160 [Cymbomonas tetramitiformis]
MGIATSEAAVSLGMKEKITLPLIELAPPADGRCARNEEPGVCLATQIFDDTFRSHRMDAGLKTLEEVAYQKARRYSRAEQKVVNSRCKELQEHGCIKLTSKRCSPTRPELGAPMTARLQESLRRQASAVTREEWTVPSSPSLEDGSAVRGLEDDEVALQELTKERVDRHIFTRPDAGAGDG